MGLRDRESYVVQQGKIRFVLTSPLKSGKEIGKHIDKHEDAIKVVALWVDNAEYSYNETIKRGAKPFFEPLTEGNTFGNVKRAGIYTYGETIHIFVEEATIMAYFTPFQSMDTRLSAPKNRIEVR